jgi:hypothetical protein
MYLPLELNTPALVGGILAHFVGKRSAPVRERGVIIASGFMAGGALGGVIGAACRLLPGYEESWIKTPFFGNDAISQIVSAVGFIGFCLYLWFGSVKNGEEAAKQ